MCIDNMHARHPELLLARIGDHFHGAGRCPGGGLECALSSDIVVAEESAQMGLPEINVNCSRAWAPIACSRAASHARRRAADLSGRVRSAAELHEMGLVDVLARDGQASPRARLDRAHVRRR